MKKILSILCAAVALICSMLSITAFASMQSDLALIDNITLAALNEYPYYLVVSGHYHDSDTTYTRVLAFDDRPDFSKSFYNDAYCNIRSGSKPAFGVGGSALSVSGSSICGFYLYSDPAPNTLVFDDMCTNIPGAIDFIKSLAPSDYYLDRVQSGSVSFPDSIDFESAVYQVLNPVPDPTEQPSGSGGIPEAWISGGHTVAPVETMTLPPEMDVESALDQMLSSQETVPPNVANAMNGFWYLFDKFLDSTGLLWFVLLSLTIVCLTWFLGRRV